MKPLFGINRKMWNIYIKQLGQHYLLSIGLILVIEILARHSVLLGISYVWDHPFLTLYSALMLTTVYATAFLFKRRKFVSMLVTVIVLMLGVVNWILLFFRITPLAATDFSLIASVFDIMSVYLPLWLMIVALTALVCIVWGIIWYSRKAKLEERYLQGAVILLLALVALTGTLMKIGDARGMLQTEFANLPDAYEDNGFVYCFARSLIDRGIEKPETYSEESVEHILETITSKDTVQMENTPNIIFLQIESFFDLSRVKNAVYSENPIPVFSSLLEEYPSGALTVPSVGAGTANTEFEVLTGMSIDYFGAGEYPYKTVLQETTCESIAYNLKKHGYHTTAIHNNTGTFYDRHKVYPNLGFDYFVSEEYMKGITYNSIGWAKDKILTQEIMQTLNTTERSDFIYAVSVQPHGKYPTEKMENPHIRVTGFSQDNEERANAFEYYVNEVHETDEFLGLLVSKLRDYKEPVILVMFGDHLPNLELTQEELKDGNLFETEYLIWTNKVQKAEKKFSDSQKDLHAYQLYAYVFQQLGINNGVLTKFHQKYSMEDIHLEQLETLQYDMLYGEREVFNGFNPYGKTTMDMGIIPIELHNVDVVGGSTYIHGDNFTEFSVVLVNEEAIESTFVNDNTLFVPDFEMEEMDRVCVAQMVGWNDELSRTQEIVFTK